MPFRHSDFLSKTIDVIWAMHLKTTKPFDNSLTIRWIYEIAEIKIVIIAECPTWSEGWRLGKTRRISQDSLDKTCRISQDSLGKTRRISQDSLDKTCRISQDSLGKTRRISQDSLGKTRWILIYFTFSLIRILLYIFIIPIAYIHVYK